MRRKLGISWDISRNDNNLKRFKRYLKDEGFRPSTLDNYIFRVSKYFEFCGDNEPSPEMAQKYRDFLMDKNLSNSSIANYSYVMMSYHELSQDVRARYKIPASKAS